MESIAQPLAPAGRSGSGREGEARPSPIHQQSPADIDPDTPNQVGPSVNVKDEVCGNCGLNKEIVRIPNTKNFHYEAVEIQKQFPLEARKFESRRDPRLLCGDCYVNILEEISDQDSSKQFPPVEIVTKLNDWKQRHQEFPLTPEFPPVEIAKKRKPGRPKKVDLSRPYAPTNYEWRADSGGWKLIYRPIGTDGKKNYAYIGFLNAKRWDYFKRFNDEKFITSITRYFEERKSGPIRDSRFGQAGG